MEIQMIRMTEIKPYWRNPRNNAPAVEAVRQSIRQFGMNQPITLDLKNVIVTGHTRYKALLLEGWPDAPCVVLDLPPDKLKAYRIADNKTNELATWNMDFLIPELKGLPNLTRMQVFFPNLDLNSLSVDTSTPEIDPERSREQVASANGVFVEVNCPHCGKPSSINRSTL